MTVAIKKNSSPVATGINALYATSLALCFITSATLIFNLLNKDELFAFKEDGNVIVRSYVQGYACGAIALSVDRFKAFDSQVQLDYTNKAISPLKVEKYIFSQYMPYLFTLMTPFAALPIKTSFIVFSVFAGLVSTLGLWLVMKDCTAFTPVERICFLTGYAASLPYLLNLFYGGLSPVIVGLLALYYWGFRRNHEITAGVSLALATLKPQYAVFAAIPLLAHKRLKIIIAAALTEAILIIMAGLNIGWENVLDYPKLLMKADTAAEYLGVFPEKMVSIRGPLSLIFPQSVTMPICLTFMIIAMFALFGLWLKTDKNNDQLSAWAMAATLVTIMIVSPHTHIYDCLYLVLPAVLTLRTTSLTGNFFTQPASLRAWSYMVILYPLLSWVLFLSLAKVGNFSSYWALVYDCVLLCLAISSWQALKHSATQAESNLDKLPKS